MATWVYLATDTGTDLEATMDMANNLGVVVRSFFQKESEKGLRQLKPLINLKRLSAGDILILAFTEKGKGIVDAQALLLDPVRSFLSSGQPGVFCAFCYSMWNHVAAAFKTEVDAFREKLLVPDLHVAFAEIRFGGISHVGAMLSCDHRLLDGARDQWIAVRDGDMKSPASSGGD